MTNTRNAFVITFVAAMTFATYTAHANRHPAPPRHHHHHSAAHGIVPFAVGLGVGLLTAPFISPTPPPQHVIVAPPPPPVTGHWVERDERVWVEGYWMNTRDAYGRQVRAWIPGHWEVRRTRTWIAY